jgi:hypothetical protein
MLSRKDKTMKRKDELLKIIKTARQELDEIETRERVQENKRLVGKYAKYRNCYSCPKPDEYWWMYLAVTGITEDGTLRGWSFQTDINGKVEVETRPYITLSGYEEISAKEFYAAYGEMMEKLSVFSPA